MKKNKNYKSGDMLWVSFESLFVYPSKNDDSYCGPCKVIDGTWTRWSQGRYIQCEFPIKISGVKIWNVKKEWIKHEL